MITIQRGLLFSHTFVYRAKFCQQIEKLHEQLPKSILYHSSLYIFIEIHYKTIIITGHISLLL